MVVFGKKCSENTAAFQRFLLKTTIVHSSMTTVLEIYREAGEIQYIITRGPSIYYVIKILAILDPTHPTCNQTLLANQTNFML